MGNSNYNEEQAQQAVRQHAIVTHDVEETSATPLTGKPASYLVGSEAPGQPAAPQIGNESATPAAPRAPEVGGESSFGMNAQPGKNTAFVQEYKQPASGLPGSISAQEIAADAASYTDGRCGNVGWGSK